MRILALNPGIILLIVFGAAALIALIAYIVYRLLHLKLNHDDEKPSDEQILNEEINRVLKPIDDEEIAKKVDEYKDENDK